MTGRLAARLAKIDADMAIHQLRDGQGRCAFCVRVGLDPAPYRPCGAYEILVELRRRIAVVGPGGDGQPGTVSAG